MADSAQVIGWTTSAAWIVGDRATTGATLPDGCDHCGARRSTCAEWTNWPCCHECDGPEVH